MQQGFNEGGVGNEILTACVLRLGLRRLDFRVEREGQGEGITRTCEANL